jgi:hypothetical protein
MADQVFVLMTGHNSEEAAHVVTDYPYGRQLRTHRRMWVEKAVKGAKKGQERGVTRTFDPKRSDEAAGRFAWNKPKEGQYSDRVFMFTDTRTGYVSFYGVTFNGPSYFLRFKATGLFVQLSDEDKKDIDLWIRADHKYNRRSWEEVEKATAELKGQLPTDGGSWLSARDYFDAGNYGKDEKGYGYDGHGMHFSDFELIYNALKAEMLNEWTLPATRGLED